MTDGVDATAEQVLVTPQEVKTMTATEITGLVNLFNGMMIAMEGRLIAKLDENSRGAADRWAKHDRDLETNTARVIARFEKMESAILTVEKTLEAHLDREHEENLIMEARVRPVKTFAEYLSRNWKTIFLIIALITTTILAWVEGIEHAVEQLIP